MKNKLILWILLVLVVCLCSALKISAQSDYKLAEQDSLALVAFYWATDGPNWISNQDSFGFDKLTSEWQLKYDGKFNKWFDGPAKDWFGVRVEKRPVENSSDSTYRVTWLWPVIGRRTDGQNNLKGYVPREIGLLSKMEQFRVNGNDGFSWELVPDEIFLPSLQHFDVESCWFGGGIPDALRNCEGIRKLNTRYNNFDYMPNLDFLSEDAVRNLDGTQWLYNARLSFAILEKIVDFFYTISPNPKEFGLEMRDMFDVGDEMEIVAPLGSSIEMICNDAGEKEDFITYQWFKDGLSKFGKTKKNYTISSVKESDYGEYKTRILNEYVKAYDQNGNYGEVLTKPIHLVPAPVPPVIERGVVSNNGQIIELYFSKPMVKSENEYSLLSVTADGAAIDIVEAEVMGRLGKIIRIHLAEAVQEEQAVSLSYTGEEIKDHNEGILEAIQMISLENRTRPAPSIIDAQTTLDGSGILINFDQYISAESLNDAEFLVQGDFPYEVASLTLAPGVVDANVSKVVIATLNEPIVDTLEIITVQYASGTLHGLYGGTVLKTDQLSVLNQVSVDKYDVTIQFEDGTGELSNLFVQGSWKVSASPMFDDGTHGDATANDHVWTYTTPLVDDAYGWDILMRTESSGFDTTFTTDPATGVTTITLTPITIDVDTILSENILLNFAVLEKQISGDTIFGIQNLDVIFNLSADPGAENIYLMGIEGDWLDGYQMNPKSGNVYADTIRRRTAGDIIEYNYRIGDDWENLSPEPRRYVVKNGVNIINDDFGIFTGVDEFSISPIFIYPNPSHEGFLHIEGVKDIPSISLYSINGRIIRHIRRNNKNMVLLDISEQPRGLYILRGISTRGANYSHKIILH